MPGLIRRSSSVLIALGALAVVFGLIASIWPISTVVTLVVIWGIYALVDGVTAFVFASRSQGASSRTLLIVTGIIGVLAGLMAIFRPLSSGAALAWVLGIWLIARGITELVGAFGEALTQPRWLLALGGIAWLIAGILFVANPGAAALTLTVWLGILAVLWGLMAISAGLVVRTQRKKPSTPTSVDGPGRV